MALKKAALGFFLSMNLIFFGVGCEKEVDGFGVKFKLNRRVLSNGLVVILVEDHTVPIVSYQTWFRVGSVDERPGITGISHLFEHLMFKGTPKYGPKQFFQELESKGAEVNAFTTRDYTVYHETFVPALLEKVVDMESDRLSNLKLDDDILNSERMVVLEERKLRTENSPDGKLQEAIWQLAYRVHPYRWPVIGYPQDLLTLTTPRLIDYFKSHYQPANAAVVVVGDIKTEETFALIKKHYSSIAARARPQRNISNEPDQREERRLVLHDSTATPKFTHAYHIPSATHDDTYALDVLSNILFEGTNSRAYHKLVEEKELMLGIGGSSFTPTYPGLFLISGTLKSGVDLAQTEAALDASIAEVQDRGVTAEEVTIAVRQLTVQVIDSVRTPHGLAQMIGTVQTIFGSPERFSEDLKKYLKVKPADVKRVAQKYLVPNNRSVVVLLPSQGARE